MYSYIIERFCVLKCLFVSNRRSGGDGLIMEWWQSIIWWFQTRFCGHVMHGDKQLTFVECIKCEKRWWYEKEQDLNKF